MSKSSGEFLTVSVLRDKGYSPMAYRYFLLQSHYRKVLAFSYEALDNAATAYNRLLARIAALSPEDGPVDEKALETYRAEFREGMDNDLNTSLAITTLFDVLKADCSDATKLALLAEFDEVLSLDLIKGADELRRAQAAPSDDEDAAMIEGLIAERQAARKEKNYARADEIRKQLTEMGIVLEDTRDGVKWKRG